MEAHFGKELLGDHLQIFVSGSLEKQSLTLFSVYYDNFSNRNSVVIKDRERDIKV
jgi:hypothetical protein